MTWYSQTLVTGIVRSYTRFNQNATVRIMRMQPPAEALDGESVKAVEAFPAHATLATRFQEHGYATGAAVSIGQTYEMCGRGRNGFIVCEERRRAGRDRPVRAGRRV